MIKVLFINIYSFFIKKSFNPNNIFLENLNFYPKIISYLYCLANELDYDLLMIVNPNEINLNKFYYEKFFILQNSIIRIMNGEGIELIQLSSLQKFKTTYEKKKKKKQLVSESLDSNLYDYFFIVNKITDILVATSLNCKMLWLKQNHIYDKKLLNYMIKTKKLVIINTINFENIYIYLKYGLRKSTYRRNTKETDIHIYLNIDGIGKYKIFTGLGFFDHMLEQLAYHAELDLIMNVKGDINIDEHHTIEDTGIALGFAFRLALGDKRSIYRYGFCLPMDDSVAQVSLDVGGRCHLGWQVKFDRYKIGNVTTEMFSHFFKSFSSSAKWNINIFAEGSNEHHQIEAIFKTFSRALQMAIYRNFNIPSIPTTKGILETSSK